MIAIIADIWVATIEGIRMNSNRQIGLSNIREMKAFIIF